MSYILDALKKAEHQRDIGQVPGIGSEHQSVMARGVSPWLYVLLVVLIINAGLLVYALWPEQSVSVPATVRQVPPVTSSAPPPTSAAVVPDAVTPRVEQPVSRPATVRQVPSVATPVSPAPALRPLPPLPETAKPAVVEQPAVRSADTEVAQSAVTPGIAAAAVAAAPSRPNDNLPVWPQVSGHLFREINSSLRVDVHVYSEHPQERFILINMQKYNEGEKLQEGPVVDEITQEGVILSFQGQRFRVRAQ
jgi:general secretion pathway protein B